MYITLASVVDIASQSFETAISQRSGAERSERIAVSNCVCKLADPLCPLLHLQTLWRAYCARRRWRPIVRLRFKYGYRTQMRERFTRWFKVVR